MRITDLLFTDKQFISLEFFPPKERSDWPAFYKNVEKIAQLDPLFVSVTHGAGGNTHGDTLEIAKRLKLEHCLEAMAHMTCIGSFRDDVRRSLDNLTLSGVDNILALRGDHPLDAPPIFSAHNTLLHASDLVSFIRETHPHLGLGVAGYPEKHSEAESLESDLHYLKLKTENGADFVITQLFFDNRLYFDLVSRARTLGINKPIIPGILPVVSLKIIKRIVSLCGATIPADFLSRLEDADRRGGAAAVQKLGVAHARLQAEGLLAGGAPGIHLYTLNRADVILELSGGLLP